MSNGRHISWCTMNRRLRGFAYTLSAKEYDLLVYMAGHPNRVISHRTLLRAVWVTTVMNSPNSFAS
jgi:DNA-binding winged helix-turn-helix (wHTH) protein